MIHTWIKRALILASALILAIYWAFLQLTPYLNRIVLSMYILLVLLYTLIPPPSEHELSHMKHQLSKGYKLYKHKGKVQARR